jgi:hypothetical protein
MAMRLRCLSSSSPLFCSKQGLSAGAGGVGAATSRRQGVRCGGRELGRDGLWLWKVDDRSREREGGLSSHGSTMFRPVRIRITALTTTSITAIQHLYHPCKLLRLIKGVSFCFPVFSIYLTKMYNLFILIF